MLFATVGDILTLRKQYQKTFKLSSDEVASNNSLTCFSTNKMIELLGEYAEEPLTGQILSEIIQESIVEVGMEDTNNYGSFIFDPYADGSTNMGYSGKNKYDSYNFYEPESVDDQREYDDTKIDLPKSPKKNNESQYNQTRVTPTGRTVRLT